MPIKALRMQIIKPYNLPGEPVPLTWEALGKTLRDLRYAASRMANYVIQQNYMWEFFRQKYKAEHAEYPPAADHKDMLYCYPALAKMFPAVAGQMINQIEQHARKVWGARKNEVLKLHQSVPSFKLDFPIIVHRKSYSIRRLPAARANVFVLQANLGSKLSGRSSYTFFVDAGDKTKRAVVERLIAQEYRQGALQIVADRKGKWYCLIAYEFTASPDDRLDPTRVMGLDLGISKAVYWAVNDSEKRGWIDGREIEEFRRRVQARRKSIERQGKYPGSGRIGHGRKRRLQPISDLQDKEANFRATTNHRYARTVVDEAVRSGCGVIQMEDLTGIDERSVFLKNWTYHDFQMKVRDKAAEAGIKVQLVNPRFTSQRCSRCGYIDPANRQDRATFVCKACGFGDLYHCLTCGRDQAAAGRCESCGGETKHVAVSADYNAAKNIAVPGIETIIAEAMAKGGTAGKNNTAIHRRLAAAISP
jgi:transposase, IS605 OrfB family, central region